MTGPVWLSLSEVARLLKINREDALGLLSGTTVRMIVEGETVHFERQSLEEYLRAQYTC